MEETIDSASSLKLQTHESRHSIEKELIHKNLGSLTGFFDFAPETMPQVLDSLEIAYLSAWQMGEELEQSLTPNDQLDWSKAIAAEYLAQTIDPGFSLDVPREQNDPKTTALYHRFFTLFESIHSADEIQHGVQTLRKYSLALPHKAAV